jgi:hypothetical protein
MTLRDAMIDWLADCFEGINFDRMSTGALMDSIDLHWEGGMRDFLNSSPDLIDEGSMTTLRKWTNYAGYGGAYPKA